MPVSVNLEIKPVFDYTSLNLEVSQFVQQQTGEIQALMKRTAQDIIEIGQKLIAVKEKLEHGRFLDWIKAEFHWSYPTAARFMQVAHAFSQNYQIDKFSPSALYLLAAPSTSAEARLEAIALAKAGEHITYSTAKAIKQKYSPAPTPPMPELEAQPRQMQALDQTPKSTTQSKIVAVRPHRQIALAQPPEVADEEIIGVTQIPASVTNLHTSQSPQPIYKTERHDTCWRLGTRQHLLYCDDPNSSRFLQRLPEKVGLLLAFPPNHDWHSEIQAETRIIIATRYLPQGKDLRLFDATLESILLLYSELGQTVVICFVPFPEILSIVNRLERRGLFVEPDSQQVHEIVSDWRAGGMKAERVNL